MAKDTQGKLTTPNVANTHTAKKIPGFSKHWEDYLLSILFILLLPLVPIIIEFWRSRRIDTPELMLTASMYSIGIGITSGSRLMFGLTVFMGIIYAFAYGATKSQQNSLPLSDTMAWISIAVIFVLHAMERYNIHIVDLKPWEFPGDRRK